MEVSSGIVILFINKALLKVSGQDAVAIFSIISNITYVGKGIFNGIAQAAQPIISRSYGSQNYRVINIVNRMLWGLQQSSRLLSMESFVFVRLPSSPLSSLGNQLS